MNPNDRFYYVSADKKAQGPFSFEEMLKLASQGRIGAKTPAAPEGEAKWIPWDELRAKHGGNPDALPPVPGSHHAGRDAPKGFEPPPIPSTDQPPPVPSQPPLLHAGPPSLPPPGGGVAGRLIRLFLWAMIPLFGIGLLLVAGIVVLQMMKQKPASLNDDEVQSVAKWNSRYTSWRKTMDALRRQGLPSLATSGESAAQKLSWWQRTFEMPNPNAPRAALERRLPAGAKLTSLTPVSMGKSADGEGVTVSYEATLRFDSAQYLVPVSTVQITQPALARFKNLGAYIVTSESLPPGRQYYFDQRQVVIPKGSEVKLPWTVSKMAVQDDKWKVIETEPFPLDKQGALEQALFSGQNPSAYSSDDRRIEIPRKSGAAVSSETFWVMRSEDEMRADTADQERASNHFMARVKQINEEARAIRQQAEANIPSTPKRDTKEFGGSGSGEPTKTGTRVVGGAAAGAGIGALAGGDGESAGWGALGGAVAGAVYDAVSKGNDKEEFEKKKDRDYQERMSSYKASKRRAESEAAAREKELFLQFETELKEAARQWHARHPPAF